MGRILDTLLGRDKHVCPWWCCFTFDNPLRKLFHDPEAICSPYVGPGDTAVDIGPGMGYFTLGLCRLTGDRGRVVAVDIQERMLAGLVKRAERKGACRNLETRVCAEESLNIDENADFVLAFWMVHEVPDRESFLAQVRGIMKPGGRFLVVEPGLHVPEKDWLETLRLAEKVGLRVAESPKVALSRAALLKISS